MKILIIKVLIVSFIKKNEFVNFIELFYICINDSFISLISSNDHVEFLIFGFIKTCVGLIVVSKVLDDVDFEFWLKLGKFRQNSGRITFLFLIPVFL